ncbi:hypothetical protein FACS1894200_05860 [Spirochaetia bacterium]|nr:hypothetical protein FACS1894200_05860 [Spirochaetia bacterium]
MQKETNENERFTVIQKASGLTIKDFAKSLGLTKDQGYKISCGRSKLSRETLDRLAGKYGVNLNWFLRGAGIPFEGENAAAIRLVDQEAAAGPGAEINEYAETQVLKVPHSLISPYHPEKLIAVSVKGDSMRDEHICNGDAVVYHPGITSGSGIYVLSVSSTLLVKRVSFDDLPRSLSLISANPAYPVRRIAEEELAEVRIAGRVIACIHRF